MPPLSTTRTRAQVFASLAAPDSPSDRAIYLSNDRGNSWDWMGQGRNWTNGASAQVWRAMCGVTQRAASAHTHTPAFSGGAGALSADGSKLVVAEWNGNVYTSQVSVWRQRGARR